MPSIEELKEIWLKSAKDRPDLIKGQRRASSKTEREIAAFLLPIKRVIP